MQSRRQTRSHDGWEELECMSCIYFLSLFVQFSFRISFFLNFFSVHLNLLFDSHIQGEVGVKFREEIEKAIEKWQEPPPARKEKPLRAPDDILTYVLCFLSLCFYSDLLFL